MNSIFSPEFNGWDLLLLIGCCAAIIWCIRDGIRHRHQPDQRAKEAEYERSHYRPRERR